MDFGEQSSGEALCHHADVALDSLPSFLGGRGEEVPKPQVVPQGAVGLG